MGVKKMLMQGIENENKELAKASKRTEPIAKEDRETPSEQVSEASGNKTEVKATSEAPIQPPKKKQEKKSASKNPGGRPTNKEKGIASRKQYTLTLKEDTYQTILEKAREEDISFAKFMERAAKEYIENHT